MRRQTAGLSILALLIATLSVAQTVPATSGTNVPPVLRFSGTLAVPAGRVLVTFGLYTDQTGGEPLWQETQTISVDTVGHYVVVLGAATALPVAVFVSGEARWLDVAVEGLVPQPRALLVSVPYALKAADAETIGGRPLSAFVLAGSSTGTGTDGLTYVNTQVLKAGLSGAGPLPQGAGTAGYLGVFTDSVNLGNSVVFQSGSSLGVGTTTPAAPFHVAGTSAPAAFFDVYSNTLGALPTVYRAARGTPAAPSAVQTDDILGGLAVRGYMTTGFSAGRGQVMFKAAEPWTDTANGTYLQFTTTPTGTATFSERMRITPAGNVGIGTATPAQMLSVAGTIESTAGGFKFPDGTMQATAGTNYTAGVGLSAAGNVFNVNFAGTGAAATVARSDHTHASYATLGANTFTGTQTIAGAGLTAGGTIQSTTGGFRFPDGTVQTSAANGVGSVNGIAGAVTIAGAGTTNIGTSGSTITVTSTHGAQGGGSLHSNATTTTAGFMSSADKSKVDTLGANPLLFVSVWFDQRLQNDNFPSSTTGSKVVLQGGPFVVAQGQRIWAQSTTIVNLGCNQSELWTWIAVTTGGNEVARSVYAVQTCGQNAWYTGGTHPNQVVTAALQAGTYYVTVYAQRYPDNVNSVFWGFGDRSLLVATLNR